MSSAHAHVYFVKPAFPIDYSQLRLNANLIESHLFEKNNVDDRDRNCNIFCYIK